MSQTLLLHQHLCFHSADDGRKEAEHSKSRHHCTLCHSSRGAALLGRLSESKDSRQPSQKKNSWLERNRAYVKLDLQSFMRER